MLSNPQAPWTSEQTRAASRRRQLKARQLDEQLAERRKEGQDEASRLAQLAASADPGVVRIWGFGSVFESSRPFRLDSDLDLAVEGGGTPAWVASQKSAWSVDWVDLYDQDPSFAAQVKKVGVLLYERR